jgi:hypothetical protein
MSKTNSVIIAYSCLEDYVLKLIEQESMIDKWLEENNNYEVASNSYVSEDKLLIETIIIKIEDGTKG